MVHILDIGSGTPALMARARYIGGETPARASLLIYIIYDPVWFVKQLY